MKRWIPRIAIGLALAFIVVYLADWTIFKLRGSPQSKVTVNQFLTIPLKGNKQEYDYTGSSDVPCSVSLFPQGGQSPCWQLRRHANQNTNL
jgi:hypothetical protein